MLGMIFLAFGLGRASDGATAVRAENDLAQQTTRSPDRSNGDPAGRAHRVVGSSHPGRQRIGLHAGRYSDRHRNANARAAGHRGSADALRR